MKDVLIIATSLDEDSRSQKLARELQTIATAKGISTELLDLRQMPLPLAGSAASWEDPNTKTVKALLQKYKRFVFAVPIYNYDVNAAAKNLLELAGKGLEGSVVGLVCAAGGKSSYMAPLGLMNSLMLDFRVWVAPRYVYATEPDWRGNTISSELNTRLSTLLETVVVGAP
jgi:NAD(P)H-dependent FMN reductase